MPKRAALLEICFFAPIGILLLVVLTMGERAKTLLPSPVGTLVTTTLLVLAGIVWKTRRHLVPVNAAWRQLLLFAAKLGAARLAIALTGVALMSQAAQDAHIYAAVLGGTILVASSWPEMLFAEIAAKFVPDGAATETILAQSLGWAMTAVSFFFSSLVFGIISYRLAQWTRRRQPTNGVADHGTTTEEKSDMETLVAELAPEEMASRKLANTDSFEE